MVRTPFLALGASLLLLGLPLTSPAQELGFAEEAETAALDALLGEEAELFGSSETISTAAGHVQHIERTPSNVFVLDREQIEAVNPWHPAEMLRFIPGFTVHRRQQYSYEISALGTGSVASNKVLVLLDGHRLVTPYYGNVPFHLIPFSSEDIERIEVVVGPESTTYGSSAFAAVVNFLTRSPQEERQELTLRAGSNGSHQENFVASSSQGRGSTKVLVTNEHRGSRGAFGQYLRGGQMLAAFPSGDSFSNQSARVSHHRKIGERTEMRFSLGATNSDVGSAPASFPFVTNEVNGRDQFLLATLNLDHALSPTRHLSFKTSFARAQLSADALLLARFGVNELSQRSSIQEEYDLRYHFEPGHWKLNLGVGSLHMASSGIYIDPSQDSDLTHDFVYANGEREFGDKFVLFLGARFVDQDIGENATSWKVAGLYRPRRDLAFRLGTGTSFRAPDQFTYFFRPLTTLQTAAGPAPLNIPLLAQNPALTNEQTHGFWQVGVEKLWRRDRLKVDFYTADYLNLITFLPNSPAVFATLPVPPGGIVPLGNQTMNVNFPGHVHLRGGTISYQRELPRGFQLSAGLNLQDLEGHPLGDHYAPNRSGNLMLYRPAEGKRLGGALTWTGTGPFSVSGQGNVGRIPGYGELGLNLERRLDEDQTLSLTVQNLLDRDHYESENALVGTTANPLAMSWGRSWYLTYSTRL